jgi:hypothetical protein
MGDSTRETASVEYATGMEAGGTPCYGPAKNRSSSALQALLGQFTDVFPDELPKGLPPERSVQLKIKHLPDSKPIKRPKYKLSIDELKEVRKQIDELLAKGFIRPSISPWGSSILFVPKKDGGLRMCVDYRLSIKLRFGTNIDYLGLMRCGTRSVVLATSPR